MSSRNTKAEKRPQQVSSDEDEEEFEANDADIDTMMDEEERERFNQMSEKDREIEIYKRLEQREIQRTREQIKRKLQAADKKKKGDGETSSGSKKKKKRKISEGSEEGEIAEKTTTGEGGDDSDNDEKEDGAISSDNDDEEAPKKKKVGSDSGVVMKTEIDEDDDGDDGVANLSTAYHKPSEVANKQKQKRAMADLLNKRRDKKKQEEERRKKEAQKAALDLDEIFGNGDNEDGKSLSSSSSSSSSRSSSPVARSRTPSPVAVPIQSREQLIKCQVFRRRLARIVHAPFFAKTVTGCFVRVQIGSNDGKQIYRIAQIMDVVETAKVYEVEPGSEVRTNRGFKLKICNSDTQRVMRLEFLSNSELSESEFAFWLKRMQETDTPLPTVDFVERKQRELQAALNYNYTDAEISVMVREKQRFIRNPTNFAFQKAELLKQKEDADQNGDTERARVLQGQINDLEEKAKKIENQRTKNLSAVTAINQRNRDHMKQIFLSTERMAANEHNKVKDDDPFTRKSARMKLVTGGNASAKAAGQGDGIASSSTSSKSAPPSASSSSLGAGNKLTVNLNLGGNDLFSAHGIDINIDLNRVLPATTTSSFRAPPIGLYGHHSQQNRPIASVSAPSNSKSAVGGGGSTRTLTLEEYKRKYSQRIAAAATATTSTAAEPSA